MNTEGRLQSFSGVCRPLGDSRPGWKVLRVLGNTLALPGFEYESSEQVRDEILPLGTEFVDGLDNGINGVAVHLDSGKGRFTAHRRRADFLCRPARTSWSGFAANKWMPQCPRRV